MPSRPRILVGQSGGPTAAINASLAGVMTAGHAAGCSVLGMRYGIEGLLAGQTADLDALCTDDAALVSLSHTPASMLGSCRYRLPDPAADEAPYRHVFERLDQLGISTMVYIGGNDSMDTVDRLGAYGQQQGSSVRVVGVPKTIDNDLVGTDHTPGYGSAARFVATTVGELACDADVYDLKSVTFVEVMGRDAGWLTAAATLAPLMGYPAPDVVLLPEVVLDPDVLMQRLSEPLHQRNTVMVAVSEGVRLADGRLVAQLGAERPVGTDAFGHASATSGVCRYLAHLAKERLGCKARGVELSTLQRCAAHAASERDLREAAQLGGASVRAALGGATRMMSALERVSDWPYEARTTMVDVEGVANQVRGFPLAWMEDDRMGVTADFRRYAAPLVGGVPSGLLSYGQVRALLL